MLRHRRHNDLVLNLRSPHTYLVVVEFVILHSPPSQLSLLVTSLPFYAAGVGVFIYFF